MRRELEARVGAGVIVGALLVAMDLGVAARLGGVGAAGVAGWAVLGLLPALGVVVAALLLPVGRLTVWPCAAAVAWFLGDALAAGARARTLPLAPWWGLIGALAVLLTGVVVLRTPRLRGVGARSLACAAALAAIAAAGLVQRGRYELVRECVVVLAALGLFLAMLPLARRVPVRVSRGLVVLALLWGLTGATFAALRQAPVDWAARYTCATAPWSLRVRRLVAVDEAPEAAEVADAAFFGTPLAARSRAAFLTDGRPRSVLFITLDATRGDLFEEEVRGKPVMPNLERLGAEGVVFERAYTSSPMSHQALFSAFSGLHPHQIYGWSDGINRVPLVTARLEKAGVPTRAVFPTVIHNARREDFTRFDFGFGWTSGHPLGDFAAHQVFDAVKPRDPSRPWFAFVHFITPHAPYKPSPEEYAAGDSEFELYAAEIRHTDAKIAQLLGHFSRAGLLDDTLVIITSDHGEEFGEHGQTKHGRQLFEESVRVPMIAFGPGVVPARVRAPVSITDIGPTLDHLFDLPEGRPRYGGRSLLPFLCGETDAGRPSWVIAEIPPSTAELSEVLTAMIEPRWKFLLDERSRRRHLFDLDRDPGEKTNAADEHPDVTRDMWARVRAVRERAPGMDALFAGLDPSLKYIEFAEWDQGVAQLTQYVVGGDPRLLTPYILVRALARFADGAATPEASAIVQRYRDHADAEVRLACRVLEGTLSSAEPDVAVLREAYSTTRDAFLAATVLEIAGAAGRRDLLDVPAPEVVQHGDVLTLALAAYRARLGADAGDLGTADAAAARALASEASWSRRHALRYLDRARRPGLWPALIAQADTAQAPALRRDVLVLTWRHRATAPSRVRVVERGAGPMEATPGKALAGVVFDAPRTAATVKITVGGVEQAAPLRPGRGAVAVELPPGAAGTVDADRPIRALVEVDR